MIAFNLGRRSMPAAAILLAIAAAILLAIAAPAGATAAHADALPAAGAGADVRTSTVRRFALVIGSNAPVREGLATLRYADDDAVKWAILLRTFGTEVELLTDLDAESQRLYGVDAPAHRSPTRSEVQAAMARLHDAIAKAHSSGARTVFYFVYAGHGDEQDDEGYVGLADGRLFRHDVEDHILGFSGADTNHAIIDACRSYYIAFDRGPGGTRRQWLAPYFTTRTASRLRNTGFILASSSGGQTHEWEEFQAGIFSHEVRSGLLGGADTNGDGRITYAELAAFVRVANQAVRNERYRPDILARAPANGDDVVLDLADAGGGLLRFGAVVDGRHVLEDALGVRWADVHPGRLQKLTLALPVERWGSGGFFVQSLANSTEYQLTGGADADLAQITPRPLGVLRRGALHEAFALLFTLPFDATALTAPAETDLRFASSLSSDTISGRSLWTPRTKRVVAATTAIGSLAALGVAAGLSVSAINLRRDAEGQNGQTRSALDDEIARRNGWTVVATAGGALLAAAATALFIWARQAER